MTKDILWIYYKLILFNITFSDALGVQTAKIKESISFKIDFLLEFHHFIIKRDPSIRLDN